MTTCMQKKKEKKHCFLHATPEFDRSSLSQLQPLYQIQDQRRWMYAVTEKPRQRPKVLTHPGNVPTEESSIRMKLSAAKNT